MSKKASGITSITKKQFEALEDFIAYSKDGTDFGRRVILWLLRQTSQLSHAVCLSIPDITYGAKKASEVQVTAHNMNSCNGSTHLGLFLEGMGQPFFLSHLPRLMLDMGFSTKIPGQTIWWSPERYDGSARNVALPDKEILKCVGPKKLRHLQYHRINLSNGGKCYCGG